MLQKLDEFIQTISRYLPFTYQRTIRTNLKEGSILDLGCGKGWSWKFFVNPNRSNSFLTVGADISLPYLKYCQEKGLYEDLIRCDVRKLPFKEKSFDVVLLLQLVEHLTKEEGLKLIDEAEKIARKQVIIGTPAGFLELDFHSSGWDPDELKGLGYKVSGHGLRLPIPNRKFKGVITQISRFSCLFPFNYHFPKSAYQMVAVKRLEVEEHHG